jgi:hypothetical protein
MLSLKVGVGLQQSTGDAPYCSSVALSAGTLSAGTLSAGTLSACTPVESGTSGAGTAS